MLLITVDNEEVAVLNHEGILRKQDETLLRRIFALEIGHKNFKGVRVKWEANEEAKDNLPLWDGLKRS